MSIESLINSCSRFILQSVFVSTPFLLIEKIKIKTQKKWKKKCAHRERVTHAQKDKNRIHQMNIHTILGLFWSVTHSLCAHIFFSFFLCPNYEFHYMLEFFIVRSNCNHDSSNQFISNNHILLFRLSCF